eukprot:TRINITY_DN44480_c0_g1_i1.p1 TRINITY_DN44480_c0_g1~~TRINITY_DN44480_c0_g1_i1.p1  ORF type:complete len:160 (+),score=18.52 TRINITY_DN44480_c0_g1_i1:23-481(+)
MQSLQRHYTHSGAPHYPMSLPVSGNTAEGFTQGGGGGEGFHTQPNIMMDPNIPYLRERLTEQGSTVSQCQQDLSQLKMMMSALQRELTQHRNKAIMYKNKCMQQQEDANRACWTKWVTVGIQFLLLICILVLLIGMSKKVNGGGAPGARSFM